MDADKSNGFILQPGEGRSIDLGGFQMTVKATSEETGGAFSLLEADEPPDFGPPLHIHHDAAEAFYVLGGEDIIFLEERELACAEFESWLTVVQRRCVEASIEDSRAREIAVEIFCLIEGAFLLARTARSIEPIRIAGRAAIAAVADAQVRDQSG